MASEKELNAKLLEAVETNDLDQVEELLEKGADPNSSDSYGQKLIHLACARANGIEVLDALVNKGADINATTDDEPMLSPLGMSILSTRPEHVEYLLDKGVEANARAGIGDGRPLHLAVSNSTPLMCKTLLEHGASANLPDDLGTTPLHFLCTGRFSKSTEDMRKLTRLFLDFKADPMIVDIEGSNSIHIAAKSNNIGSAKELLKKDGVDLEARDRGGATALFRASAATEEENRDPVLKKRKNKLIQVFCKAHAAKGVGVDAKIGSGNSAFMIRVALFYSHQNLESIKILLDHGADPQPDGLRRRRRNQTHLQSPRPGQPPRREGRKGVASNATGSRGRH